MNENITRQFTMQSVWDRLGRATISGLAYMTAGINGIPQTQLQWLGLAGVIAAAIWTGKNGGAK